MIVVLVNMIMATRQTCLYLGVINPNLISRSYKRRRGNIRSILLRTSGLAPVLVRRTIKIISHMALDLYNQSLVLQWKSLMECRILTKCGTDLLVAISSNYQKLIS